MYLYDSDVLQTWRISYRWSVVAAILAALFWGVWHFIGASVPTSPLLHLSRWWDVVTLPLFVFAIFWLTYLLFVVVEEREYLWETPSMVVWILGAGSGAITAVWHGGLLGLLFIPLTIAAILVANLVSALVVGIVWVL